jgi:hypothetical protein
LVTISPKDAELGDPGRSSNKMRHAEVGWSWRDRIGFAVIAAASVLVGVLMSSPFNHAIILGIVHETAETHGVDPEDFARMAEIESGFDPRAYHPISRASGLFQFIPSTAQQYKLEAVFNPEANANAAAALWLDNSRALRQGLRRNPTPGEIYLAHQQGATGAINLLMQPDKLAGEVVGYDAVTMNGGTAEMSAGMFAAKWVSRFQQE